MKLKIQIGLNVLEPALRYALSDRTIQKNFFSAFRTGIGMQVDALLKSIQVGATYHKPPPAFFRPETPLTVLDPINIQGQSLDAEFCLGYGFGDSSISALNYLYKGARENSLLPFLESDLFTLGNFLYRIEPGNYELEVEFIEGVTATGYATSIQPRSVRSFLAILGLRFTVEAIKSVADQLPETAKLDELSACTTPPLWINRRTGQTFTCSCFSYLAKKQWRSEFERNN
ncbi:MAG: hypothetical protein ACOYOF_19785, partial [Verrucomicrobiaceae bacterium]